MVYCQGYDGLRDIPAENAAQFYALLDEQPLLKNQDDTLCAILNEEAAPSSTSWNRPARLKKNTTAGRMASSPPCFLKKCADAVRHANPAAARFAAAGFCWLRKPPAMPVEVSRKKALASSIERSESRITIKQIRMHSIKAADARLRAAGHLMLVKNHSVHL